MNEKQKHYHYSIEKWAIYPDQNLIVSGSDQISIEPKTMSVLVFLIEKQGRTISREEFINEVWGGIIVTENSLNQSISKLRKIFNDETAKPRIIETVSKRGYRLIAQANKINFAEQTSIQNRVSGFSLRTGLIVLCAIATLTLILWIYPKANQNNKEYQSRIFSSIEGMERHPSFTKTGDQVVYVFGNVCNDESEIRIQPLDSDLIHNFAKIPGFKKFPRFSGDGKEVIFWNEIGRPTKSILYHFIPPDTSLIELLEIPTAVRGLDWTWDKRFAVYSAKADSLQPFCIYIFDMEKKSISQVTRPTQSTGNDLFPVFSEDGKSIAFARRDGDFDFDIWTVELETKNLKRLTFDNLTILGVDWSENDIYYSRLTERDEFQLVRLDPTSRSAVLSASRDQYSALSARNKHLIYQTNTKGISIINHNLITNRRSVLFNSNFEETYPEYSRNGESFSFISNRTGPYQLWIGDVGGAQTKRVSTLRLSNWSSQPRWSPDGHFLIFDKIEKGEWAILKVGLTDGDPKLFLKDASRPVFSSDGNFVYFNSRRSGSSQIWKIPSQGGTPVQVTFKGGIIGFESDMDSSFYFMKDGEDGIWQKNGSSERLVLSDFAAGDFTNWRLFNDKIYFAKRYNAIWSYDIRTKVVNQLITIDAGTCGLLNGLSLSPDGKSILFSHDERIESDLMILDY